MQVRAQVKNLSVSPRKIRLIVDRIRGKKVDDALAILRYMPSPHAKAVAKVVKSAVANAENTHQLIPDDLVIVQAFADMGMGGRAVRRWRPRSRGMAHPYKRYYSHVTVVVEEMES